MKIALFPIAVMVAAQCVGGCQTSAGLPDLASSRLEHVSVGTNLVGETCWLEAGTMAYESLESANFVLDIYCGDWEWPSARVFRVQSESADLDQWSSSSSWRRTIDSRMWCGSRRETTTILDNVDAILLDCKLKNGGWPYVAFVTYVNGAIFLADGIPAAQGPLERTIARASSYPVEPITSAAIAYLQDRLQERIYRAGDLQDYYRAMTLGQHYNSIKEFSKAENQYRRALDTHQRVLGIDNAEIADPLMHIALELSNQEQFSRAEESFRRVRDKIDREIDAADYARLLSYEAIHLANQGKFTDAATFAEESERHRKMLVPQDLPRRLTDAHDVRRTPDGILSLETSTPPVAELAHSLYIEAATSERLGRIDEAAAALRQAHAIINVEATPPTWEPQIRRLDGIVEESRQAFEEARVARVEASTLYGERTPGERPTTLALIELGKSDLHDGDVDGALDKLREAVSQARARSDGFRLGQLTPYFSAVMPGDSARPIQQQALAREMFETAQLVRSSATAHEIARTVARFAERDDEVGKLIRDLQDQEYERVRTQQSIQAEARRVLEDGHVERLEELNRDLTDIDRQLRQLSEQVQAISPEYRQLVNSSVKADEVIAALRSDEALVQVLVGNQNSFVFFIHGDRVTAYSVAVSSAEVVEVVNGLRNTITAGRGVTVLPAGEAMTPVTSAAEAHRLYMKLFSPVADDLERASHLVAVATGPLLSFPFGLFVTEPPPTGGSADDDYFSGVAWLARRTAISLVPSAQSFVYLRRHAQPSTAPKPLIAFGGFESGMRGDEESRGLLQRLCRARKEDVRRYFTDLPGTVREIEAVAAKFASADTFLRDRFNEEAVKTAPLDEYRVVYFATHALLPDEVECSSEPSLVTSFTSPGDGDDGFLTSSEIWNLQLDADLVVMSACNTGGADRPGGESLSGLARAFFFSGARSLLATHWRVDDDATAYLMERVFEQLRTGRADSLSAALQAAQSSMMDEPQQSQWARPFFWAAFTLVGDGALSLSGI